MGKKRNLKIVINILISNVSLVVLGGITVWLGYAAATESIERHKVRQEITRLKDEIRTLEDSNSHLTSYMNSLEDIEVVELEAKRRLNLKRPGEQVAVILRDGDSEPQNITDGNIDAIQQEVIVEEEITEQKGESSNPIKWWRYITNRE
jgi:cell division protein FtsB